MKRTRRRRRSQAEWQQLLDEQKSSGLSQEEFCIQRSISQKRFTHWKRRLQKAKSSPPDNHWLELPGVPAMRSSGWEIELDLGQGLRLRLRQP
jgi:hypothetical protein